MKSIFLNTPNAEILVMVLCLQLWRSRSSGYRPWRGCSRE